ncbi:Ubiquitin-protein ligase E3C [Halotydeus destructor]|nr:Ubiquitin-protein ligase E3C [Halotydeus destructor]
MYSFEGKFRRTPNVDLGGASRKVPRDELIQRAAIERKQREDFRKQTLSATTIQSVFRSYSSRTSLRNVLRSQFDVMIKKTGDNVSASDLDTLYKWLLLFQLEKGDSTRLVKFGQILLKNKNLVCEGMTTNRQKWLYRIQRFILLNVKYMASILASEQSQSMAIPLRLIEDFTSLDIYKDLDSNTGAETILSSIWSFEVYHGYFDSMRRLFDSKIPEPYEETTRAPTPLANSLLDLTLRPLKQQYKKDSTRKVVVQQFFKQLVRGPLSPQIKNFLIPVLISNTPENLKPQILLQAIVVEETERLTIPKSVWLLYTMVKLVAPHVHSLDKAHHKRYLLALRLLTDCIPEQVEYEDDDDEPMDTSEASVVQSSLSRDVLELLNSPQHISGLMGTDNSSENVLDDSSLTSLCRICYAMISSNRFAVNQYRLLYTLAFSPSFLRLLWERICTASMPSAVGTPASLIQMLSGGLPLPLFEWNKILPQLTVFCALLSYLLPTVDDVEFYETSWEEKSSKFSSMPFTLDELRSMTLTLRDVCIGLVTLAYHDTKLGVRDEYKEAMRSVRDQHSDEDEDNSVKVWKKLFKNSVQLLKQLYNRDSRRAFCPFGHWISKQISIPIEKPTNFRVGVRQRQRYQQFRGLRRLTREELEDDGPPLSTTEIRNITILQEVPFVVPFTDRVKILQVLMNRDKEDSRGSGHNFLLPGSSIDVLIRRNYIYEDASEKLSLENEPSLKKPLRVQLVNAVGLDEAGIDGGGIFREFLNELLKTAFDPNRGFFKSTQDSLYYPNPAAPLIVNNYQMHYFFIGRMLGKAIYENMLVELPFATFFLAKMLAEHSTSDVDIHHLASLDPLMYKNLVFLKNYEGDVSELGIDFTVLNSELGENELIELKPNGKSIPVTAQNRIEYIHLMADYRLNKQIRPHCAAFKQGLSNVIELDWLRMFSPRELQILISGTPNPIDIDDLRKYTNYSGGYSEAHPVIKAFWKVVSEFDEKQRRQLLKFVTSCSRPPLLGFKNLHPPFCIHYAGKDDRLPTSSTCMNLLKLPEYIEKETLRQKVLYAIESGVGFELS